MWLDDDDWIFGFLNGYVNFIGGSLVEWDGGWVVVWLDDGDWMMVAVWVVLGL